jgi:hypothetical protein
MRFSTPVATRRGQYINGRKNRKGGGCMCIEEEFALLGDRGPKNPEYIEWLMGWPIGMTALEPLEMDKFQKWLELHGKL